MMNNYVLTSSLKAKRKPNYSDDDNLFLLGEFEKNKEILRSKMSTTEVNKRKYEVWQEICYKLNQRNPQVQRSVYEVRRKWKNMVTAAKKEATSSKGDRPPSQVTQRIMRGYFETDDQTNVNSMASPTGSDISTSGGASEEFVVQQENGSTMKVDSQKVEQNMSIDNSTDEAVFPRIDEVRSAVECGIEVVQPGPPAAALTEQPPPTMRSRPINQVQFRPKLKHNNIHAILYNAKKRKLQAQSVANTSTSLDIQQLKKEKIMLEKEKIVLEKEKLVLEKEKLMLEIQCLKCQLNGDDPEY